MDLNKVKQFLEEQNFPNFRLNQIREAFFIQSLGGFEQITNIPQDLRNNLKEKFSWLLVKETKTQGSVKAEVAKSLLKLEDKQKIESVLMIYRDWISACLSVMVGCPLGCTFCATGQMGFKRNLTAFEIIDQIVYWNEFLKSHKIHESYKSQVTRVVFMGMGEPFLNWENVWEAIKIINAKDGLNIGQRHITVSTAGIISKIYEFTDLDTEINLAISLHSPFQGKKEEIMPIAKQNPLPDLLKACEYYVSKTKRKLFFEYALINGFNDGEEDVLELKKVLTNKLFHLNLII